VTGLVCGKKRGMVVAETLGGEYAEQSISIFISDSPGGGSLQSHRFKFSG
jgi:hypothetical protein